VRSPVRSPDNRGRGECPAIAQDRKDDAAAFPHARVDADVTAELPVPAVERKGQFGVGVDANTPRIAPAGDGEEVALATPIHPERLRRGEGGAFLDGDGCQLREVLHSSTEGLHEGDLVEVHFDGGLRVPRRFQAPLAETNAGQPPLEDAAIAGPHEHLDIARPFQFLVPPGIGQP